MLREQKGQGTLEYALIIAVVVAALLAMQFYMRRGVQGKLRESIDSVGAQYSAGNVTSTVTTQQAGTITTKEKFGLDPADTADATPKQGVSYSEVTSLSGDYEVKQSAQGDEKEKITKTFIQETLLPPQ